MPRPLGMPCKCEERLQCRKSSGVYLLCKHDCVNPFCFQLIDMSYGLASAYECCEQRPGCVGMTSEARMHGESVQPTKSFIAKCLRTVAFPGAQSRIPEAESCVSFLMGEVVVRRSSKALGIHGRAPTNTHPSELRCLLAYLHHHNQYLCLVGVSTDGYIALTKPALFTVRRRTSPAATQVPFKCPLGTPSRASAMEHCERSLGLGSQAPSSKHAQADTPAALHSRTRPGRNATHFSLSPSQRPPRPMPSWSPTPSFVFSPSASL